MSLRTLAATLFSVALVGVGLSACQGGSETPPAGDSGSGTAGSRVAVTAPPVAPCPSLPAQQPVEGGLPPLRLPCLGEGPDVRLSDLRGKPTVVNVWAAWCVNCEREMPLFASVMDEVGEDVRFLGVHYKAARDFGLQSQSDFRVPFPSVHDEEGDRVVAGLRATAPPHTLFVDADGRIVGREIGEIESEQQLRDLIAEHFGIGPTA